MGVNILQNNKQVNLPPIHTMMLHRLTFAPPPSNALLNSDESFTLPDKSATHAATLQKVRTMYPTKEHGIIPFVNKTMKTGHCDLLLATHGYGHTVLQILSSWLEELHHKAQLTSLSKNLLRVSLMLSTAFLVVKLAAEPASLT